jgi:hypothetical protein
MSEWTPYREPLRRSLFRTVGIALVAGALIAPWAGGIAQWPALTLLVFWPSLGGHLLDLAYLNCLRPRLPDARSLHIVARVAVWFIGGILLGAGVRLTARLVLQSRDVAWLTWAIAGAACVGMELVAHGALRLRGRPSFYDGRG